MNTQVVSKEAQIHLILFLFTSLRARIFPSKNKGLHQYRSSTIGITSVQKQYISFLSSSTLAFLCNIISFSNSSVHFSLLSVTALLFLLRYCWLFCVPLFAIITTTVQLPFKLPPSPPLLLLFPDWTAFRIPSHVTTFFDLIYSSRWLQHHVVDVSGLLCLLPLYPVPPDSSAVYHSCSN